MTSPAAAAPPAPASCTLASHAEPHCRGRAVTSPAAAAPPAPASCTLASHAELKLDRERWIAGTTHAFYQDLAGTMAEFRYCKGCGSSLTRAKVSP